MDDSGAPLAADAAQIVDVMEQRVDERAARMSGGGMDDHARRLVDDDQVAILVDDVERQRFGLRLGIDRLRDQDFDLLSTAHALIRPGGAPVDLHVAVFDQPLDLRPRLRRSALSTASSGTVIVTPLSWRASATARLPATDTRA